MTDNIAVGSGKSARDAEGAKRSRRATGMELRYNLNGRESLARRDGSLSGRAHRVARPVMISEPRSSPTPPRRCWGLRCAGEASIGELGGMAGARPEDRRVCNHPE